MKQEYILATGKKGAKRLENVQLLYGEESKWVLKKAGLKQGMMVMDAGCGTGLMTKWLAEQVGNRGHIIAMDNNEKQLQLAKEYLDENNIFNVTYLCKGIHELNHDDLINIDLFYARLVMVHNKNPLSILQNIKNNCQKNLSFIFEEPITSESECIPISKAFNKHLELYYKLGQEAGFDFDFGNKLIDLMKQSELNIEGMRKTKNFFSDYTTKLIAYQRTQECSEKYLQNHMIKEKELEILLEQLMKLANDQNFLISGVNMVQIWGTIP